LPHCRWLSGLSRAIRSFTSCGKTSPSQPLTTKCMQAITLRQWPL
jgi:hypothetical protein